MVRPPAGSEDRSTRCLRVHVLASMASASPRGGESGLAGVLNRACRTLAAELDASGAAVNLMSMPVTESSVIGTSDLASARIDDLQFTMGEGPCHDALRTGRPVQSTDLGTEIRWPGYCSAAWDSGVRAVYAFPLQVGAINVGVLDVYFDRPEVLDEDELALALAFAEIATETLLHADADARAGGLDPGLSSALGSRAHIYQAQGMVMIEQHISLSDALMRMRGFAFAHQRTIADVAANIVSGTLVMTAEARP